jgi:hypothetical protein
MSRSSSAAWFHANKRNPPRDKRLALPGANDDANSGEELHLQAI